MPCGEALRGMAEQRSGACSRDRRSSPSRKAQRGAGCGHRGSNERMGGSQPSAHGHVLRHRPSVQPNGRGPRYGSSLTVLPGPLPFLRCARLRQTGRQQRVLRAVQRALHAAASRRMHSAAGERKHCAGDAGSSDCSGCRAGKAGPEAEEPQEQQGQWKRPALVTWVWVPPPPSSPPWVNEHSPGGISSTSCHSWRA